MRLFALILGLILAVTFPARADEVRLRNGAVIQGRVVRDDKDAVVVEVGNGRMNLARRDVVSVTINRTDPAEPSDKPVTSETPAPRRVVARENPRPQPIPPQAAARRAATPAPVPKIVAVERLAPTPVVGVEVDTSAKKTRAPADSKAKSRPVASKPTVKPDW
jgi:hypothetical protein